MLRVAIAPAPDRPDDGVDALAGWAGESERRRWHTLSPSARRGFVASRRLLRDLLQAVTGVRGEDWEVSAEPGTAPVPRPLHGDVPRLVASLSHRLGWVAAAVADRSVGIDIECDRPARSDPAERAALMLAAGELADWRTLPEEVRESALLARWTAKEAWFKASPPGDAPWDFRQVVARTCAPEAANVRLWHAPPLHVAVCCPDAGALAAVRCDGLPDVAKSTCWHVERVQPAA